MSLCVRRAAAGVLASVVLTASLAAITAPAGAALAPPQTGSPAAVVLDSETGTVLFGKGMHRHYEMASCTKIMTALLALERLSPQAMLRVPRFGPKRPGTTLGLRTGEVISAGDALRALMLLSANDAGVTLACGVAGSEVRFVKLMNARAAAWGLRDTHFDNCTGHLADPRHHTSALDLAVLARRAMQDPRFAGIVGLRSCVVAWTPGQTRTVYNTNYLLAQPWADGVKCGVTKSARSCLVGSGRLGLRELITVTLHAPTRAQGLADTLAMFQFGSSLYEGREVVRAGEVVGEVTAADGGTCMVAAAGTVSAVVRSAAPVERSLVVYPALMTAPPAGTVVGSVVFRADGVQIGATDLVIAP